MTALGERVDRVESRMATEIITVVSQDDPADTEIPREVTGVGRCAVPAPGDRLILTVEPTGDDAERTEAIFPVVDLTDCLDGRWTADFAMGAADSAGQQFWVRLYLGPEDELGELIASLGDSDPVSPDDGPSRRFLVDELKITRDR